MSISKSKRIPYLGRREPRGGISDLETLTPKGVWCDNAVSFLVILVIKFKKYKLSFAYLWKVNKEHHCVANYRSKHMPIDTSWQCC